MTRRDILQISVISLSLIPASELIGCIHPSFVEPVPIPLQTNTIQIDIHSQAYQALEKIGGSVYVVVQSKRLSLIVTRISDSVFYVVSSTCTHAGCDVNLYDPLRQGMLCDCHGSVFAPDGKVLGGPAPFPLTSFPATFDGDSKVKIDIS